MKMKDDRSEEQIEAQAFHDDRFMAAMDEGASPNEAEEIADRALLARVRERMGLPAIDNP